MKIDSKDNNLLKLVQKFANHNLECSPKMTEIVKEADKKFKRQKYNKK